jgi:DNA replication protein DnaT
VARIRTIKPTFWGDAKVNRLTWDARLLLIGLISMADDRGRFIATHSSITGYVFPHEEPSPAKFKRLMREITDTGIVDLYRVDGHQYGRLRRWGSHQKISHPQPSVLPNMPGEETPE